MKFQKITSLFLAFFLFVSNIGLAMNVHYCGDEIASISISSLSNSNNTEDDCCGVIEKQSHCCKDKVVHLEKKIDHATAFTIHSEIADVFVYDPWQPIIFSNSAFNECASGMEYSYQSNAPPLFKLYSQYIFYDRF